MEKTPLNNRRPGKGASNTRFQNKRNNDERGVCRRERLVLVGWSRDGGGGILQKSSKRTCGPIARGMKRHEGILTEVRKMISEGWPAQSDPDFRAVV